MRLKRTATELAGRTVVVTGGARGIGLETAREALRRGARVALLDVTPGAVERAADELGHDGSVLGLSADVRDVSSLEAAFARVTEVFGGYDTVVVNAGVGTGLRTFRATAPAEYDRIIDVNLHGAAHTVRVALDQVLAARGQFVFVSSVLAFNNGALQSPYAMSKAGAEALARALHVELAGRGVDVTIAYLAYIDTVLNSTVWADEAARGYDSSVPRLLKPRLGAEVAGRGLADAIADRRKTLVVPGRWRALLLLRGLWGPLSEWALRRDSGFTESVVLADRPKPLA